MNVVFICTLHSICRPHPNHLCISFLDCLWLYVWIALLFGWNHSTPKLLHRCIHSRDCRFGTLADHVDAVQNCMPPLRFERFIGVLRCTISASWRLTIIITNLYAKRLLRMQWMAYMHAKWSCDYQPHRWHTCSRQTATPSWVAPGGFTLTRHINNLIMDTFRSEGHMWYNVRGDAFQH